MELNLNKYSQNLNDLNVTKDIGKVTKVSGLIIRGYVTGCSIGSVCEISAQGGRKKILSEVIGFDGREVLLMPLSDTHGVGHGAKIVLVHSRASVSVGAELLGRVVNGLGEPLDDKEALSMSEETSLYSFAVNPLDRNLIKEPLELGVRSIDSFLTVGRGQRMAIMAGSGVGKSVLLGMMAKNAKSDVNVIALIGERGREVQEFIEYNLGEDGLRKSIVVAVTSDQSPLIRMRGAFLATAYAEYFATQGKNVFLMMDSVTRFSMAQREMGLSAGEPPTSKGYTPSVFSTLPRLLERAGSFKGGGSITGLYTVLVEGDDMDEPIADAIRSIVDGHIVLDRKIAQKGHFPAVDILQSTSRVMRSVTSDEHQSLAQKAREVLSVYKEAEDLINIGAYKKGVNPKIDYAISVIEPLTQFLRQEAGEDVSIEDSIQNMKSILRQ